LTVPPGVTTLIFPLLAPVGTLTFSLVAVSETMVAAFLPKLTLMAPDRFVPLMVTVLPTGPLVGLMDVIVGAAARQSVRLVDPVPTVCVPAGHAVAAVAPVEST
jgi:hypothetical protein